MMMPPLPIARIVHPRGRGDPRLAADRGRGLGSSPNPDDTPPALALRSGGWRTSALISLDPPCSLFARTDVQRARRLSRRVLIVYRHNNPFYCIESAGCASFRTLAMML